MVLSQEEMAAMENEISERNDSFWAKEFARVGLCAPFVALGVRITAYVLDEAQDLFWTQISMQVAGFMVLLGFVFAFIGLCCVKKRYGINKSHGKRLLMVSMLGLVLNGMFLGRMTYIAIQYPVMFFNDGSAAVVPKESSGEISGELSSEFSMKPPSGFERVPLMEKMGVRYSFNKENSDGSRILLLAFDIGQKITPTSDIRRICDVPSDTPILQENWKGHPVQVTCVKSMVDGEASVAFNVVIPTIPTAFIVRLVGPQAREEEIRKYLREILQGIEGPTDR